MAVYKPMVWCTLKANVPPRPAYQLEIELSKIAVLARVPTAVTNTNVLCFIYTSMSQASKASQGRKSSRNLRQEWKKRF